MLSKPKPAPPFSERPLPAASGLRPVANAMFVVQFLKSRAAGDAQEITVPKDKALLNFQLRVPDEQDYPAYRLVISDAAGKELWQAAPVSKDKFGNFNILLGKDFLKPGSYTLKVYGIANSQPTLISQNPFRIL